MLKALAKDPAQRYSDADSFIKELEGVEERAAAGPGGHREHRGVRAGGGRHGADRARAGAAGAAAPRAPPAAESSRPPPPPAIGEPPEGPPDGSRRRWLAVALLAGLAALVAGSRSCCSGPRTGRRSRRSSGQTLEQARQRARPRGSRRRDQAPHGPGAAGLRVRAVAESGPGGRQGLGRHAVRLERPEHGEGARTWSGSTEADARRRVRRADLRPESSARARPRWPRAP